MKPEEKKRIFDGLISNGLRHLGRGLRNFESGELDFAVTDAFFGIEIVLKALVFHQQWDLIFADPANANPGKLKRGECRTIGRKDAIKRLKDLGLALPTSIQHFTVLENHRNKLVHYFHPDLGTDKQRRRIAAELANAWGALRALTKLPEFSAALEAHATGFGALEARLLVLDNYLDDQAIAIRTEHARPERLAECSACHRETYDDVCLLCGYHEPSHRELTQGDERIGPANCPVCWTADSVVVCDNRARCTKPECGAWFGAMHRCEYCGDYFVVENEDDVIDDEDQAGEGSFYKGCDNCDGRAGELAGRDD